MQVRAKLAFLALPTHCGDDLVANDEATDVGAACFGNELLHHEVRLESAKRLDHALGGLLRLGEHDANTLGALEQLDDDGRTTRNPQEVFCISR